LNARADRSRGGTIDISTFTKIEIEGSSAVPLLDHLCADRLPQKVDGIASGHMLNIRGRIELAVTVASLGSDPFYLVCAAFFEQRLLDRLADHMPDECQTEIRCLSDSNSALALNGPMASCALSI
jgi:dimethylglycine dehydrogenase